MSESRNEPTFRASDVAPDLHAVLNCLAAIQCQWFLLKSGGKERLAENASVNAIDRLLEELSSGLERVQNKMGGN